MAYYYSLPQVLNQVSLASAFLKANFNMDKGNPFQFYKVIVHIYLDTPDCRLQVLLTCKATTCVYT